MEEDDDLFLVIVGNENGEDVNFPLPICTKQEQLDETDLPVEDIIETVEKHGQLIDTEFQSVCKDYEYLEDEILFQEKSNIEMIEDISVLDKEYLPLTKKKNNKSKEKVRRSMLKPGEWKSFVADLKEEYPELKTDNTLLVSTLAMIMRNVKAPAPPNGYCLQVDDVFECTLCNSCTDTEPALRRHYQEMHGPRYLMCYACGVDFRSATNLYKHEKRCSAPDARVVLQARATCIGSKGRSRPYLHLRKNAPPKTPLNPFDCKLCSASFSTKCNLIAHECMHRGERPHQCHICPAAYTSHSALLRHVKRHSDVQYICDHCGRSFKLKITLIAHMNTHLPQRKYGCEECPSRFAQKSALKLHVDRVHRHLPPPCACQICPKRYPRMSVLKKHMQKEHGLLIMTRKMFFKELPMLSTNEVQQVAKLVFRADEKAKHENNEDTNENSEVIVPDDLSSEDFLELLNKFKDADNNSHKDNRIVVIENGQVTRSNSKAIV